MPDNDSFMHREPTGIAGLDRILEGGLLRAGVYLIQGPPGAGKTILGNHLCFNAAAKGGRAVYLTLLAESHARMMAHLRRMAFFDESAVGDRVYYIGGFSTLEAGGLDALVTLVRGAMQKQKATLMVIDGLVSAEESAPSHREFKKFVHEVQTLAEMSRCTVILLTNTQRAAGVYPEHTMVDGVLRLTDEVTQLRPLRHIQVMKLRGTAPVRGLHSVRISDAGFEVWPRIESRFALTPFDETRVSQGPKLGTGVPELDAMLRGGFRPGSLTLLLGSSGSGKTVLGMQFLAEGLKKRERVVYFGFYEHPSAIVSKCQRVGIHGIAEGVQRGDAELVWHRPVEGVIDELGDSLISTVRKMRATRLQIDGIQGFEIAADFKERMSEVYSALAQELERMGVTTVYTSEMRALFGSVIEEPIQGLSAATQNIIVLRHVEHEARLLRSLSILKIRDDDYDPSIRELLFTDHGIRLGDKFPAEVLLSRGGGMRPDRTGEARP